MAAEAVEVDLEEVVLAVEDQEGLVEDLAEGPADEVAHHCLVVEETPHAVATKALATKALATNLP